VTAPPNIIPPPENSGAVEESGMKLATANGESVSRRINPRDILLFGKK